MLKRFSEKQKLIVLLAFVVLISLTLAACDSSSSDGTSPDPETYQLSFDYLGEGDLPELDGEYDEDSSVEISADPANGWEFYKWEGEGVQNPEESSTSVLVSSDQEIRAIFIEEYDGETNADGYAGWEGTEDKPYLIKNAIQLDNIRENLDASFILIEDIDLNYDQNDEWDPIGDYWWDEDEERWLSISFIGQLDGRGYKISNLKFEYYDDENIVPGSGIGFFSVIENAKVTNINFTDAEIKSNGNTGIVTGRIENGSIIRNCYVEGNIESNFAVGGITGTNNDGEILDSTADVNITSDGSVIEENGPLLSNTGGIVGTNNAGEVNNSVSYGNISAEGNNVGGIVGSNRLEESLVKNSYANGKIEGNNNVGGLVGFNESDIENSYATGDVEGKEQIGGLVGGFNEGEIIDSFAKGIITGESDVGGLIGGSNGEIIRSYALGEVYGLVENGGHFGGLAGTLNGNISESFADVNVELLQDQDEHSVAGGLVGFVGEDGKIDNSYATGNVLSEGDESPLGGLSGENRGEITNSFSAGKVDEGNNNGGFSGNNDHIIEYSYYDKDTSEQNDENKAISKSTEEMMQQDTFEPEWDFNDIWEIDEGSSYPYLQWQDNNIPTPDNI
ncbi:hypothetical protein I0Q91_03405 [Halanaerobiaceae bacterium Z-7014]|uniref:Bacterial repeat domain-containing protein n=1 Tax=Halonatronomonas betaini TaxID=2778430 RepID=A0A931AQD6_9FIRM|nr:GLUG motif-containing protein [Halonatronomonas betaini]MBF8436114.1 hypothetical protein [Halonatronomonas betaini]